MPDQQVEDVVQRAIRRDDDDVADRLALRTGIENGPRLTPGIAPVRSPGELRWTMEGRGVSVGFELRARRLEAIPNHIGEARPSRVGGD